MLRTIWGDNERYLSTYWERFHSRYYVAGDSAHRDADGYFWIMGRIDDVLKVSGHRLGTMEIESALVANPRVAEAAVVGKADEIKGESVFAFVVLRGARPKGDSSGLVKELRDWVGEQLGPIAKPDTIRFADNLPKTRSGKIMRRLLRAIANDQPITQDVSTLENPAIVDQLRGIDTPPAGAAVAPQARPQGRATQAAPRNQAREPAKASAPGSPSKTKAGRGRRSLREAQGQGAALGNRQARPGAGRPESLSDRAQPAAVSVFAHRLILRSPPWPIT